MKFTKDEDINILRYLIDNGCYDSPWRHKNSVSNDWIINDALLSYRYRGSKTKDVIRVDIYYDKFDDDRCFKNGYMHTTSRTVFLKDFLLQKRKLKINKIKETII